MVVSFKKLYFYTVKTHFKMFKEKKILFLVALFFLVNSYSYLFSQEKKGFLQNRFNGFTEVITKDYTIEKLTTLKNELANLGVQFIYSNLKLNKQNEIIHITILVKNKKSNSTITIDDNEPIPDITVGETYGFVTVIANKPTNFNPTEIKNSIIDNVDNSQKKPIYFIDGKEVSQTFIRKIDTNTIKSVSVLKGASAIKKYGTKGKNGVIIVTIKKD